MDTIQHIGKLAVVCVIWMINSVFGQQYEPEEYNDASAEPRTTLGPDDLVTVDYIIIAFTSLVVGGLLIGGIIFACLSQKKHEKEKANLYHTYLGKDEFASVNKGYTETL